MKNVEQMKLNEAYSQMTDYAAEILKKKTIYKNKYARIMIVNAVKRAGITNDEILRFYFGNYIDVNMGRRIMDKMASDLLYQDGDS